MYKSKYNTFLTIILVILIIMILGVAGFWVYDNFYKKYKIASDATDEISEIDKFISEKKGIVIELDDEEENKQSSSENNTSTNNNSYSYNPNKTYGLKYKGYGVLGKIELPKVGLQYPVLETMTNANSIDVSVAVQYGVRIK